MLITKLNPQNPDFAESEGSGEKAKKQTEFVLSKKPTSRARDARKSSLFRRYAPHKSCHSGKILSAVIKTLTTHLISQLLYQYEMGACPKLPYHFEQRSFRDR